MTTDQRIDTLRTLLRKRRRREAALDTGVALGIILALSVICWALFLTPLAWWAP